MKLTYKLVISFVLICICAITLTACKPEDEKKPKTVTVTTEQSSQAFERIIAVIETIDYTNKVFALINLENEEKLSLKTEAGVELTDKFGEHITVNQFKKGDIVRVKYDVGTFKPESITITAEIWEYKNVAGLVFDKDKKLVRKGADLYTYTDNLMIIQDNENISSDEISAVDLITIKGYKNQIWVIQVDNGHGTLTLKNHKYFIDGILDAGLGKSEVITEEFSVEVPVGVINLRIEKGNFFEEKEVMIEKDKEYVLDLAYLDSVVPKLGKIEFKFDQPGVTLLINGRVTSYAEQLELPYGDYTIQVKKTGFENYDEVFRHEESYIKKEIKLTPTAKEPEPVDKTDPVDPGNDTQTSSPTDITIRVLNPTGTEVYVDGLFKGVLPKDIILKKGNHKIILKKEGYNTAEYTIEVEDGLGKEFTFPELTIRQ